MSQQHINTDIPNSGNGDALRDAFVKTEDNFTDLYGNKVDKISGKDLSSNDFTTAEKNKLAGIPADAEKNVQADFLTNDPDDDSYIKNKPTFITGVAWGDITGTLSAQTDLQNALDSLPTFEYVDSKISQTVNSGITDFSPSEDAVFNALTPKENKLEKNIANGYAGLDGAGKILASQLPNSVIEYKGVYNAATNTPTLVDGIGNTGDAYRVTVSGAGVNNLNFVVGDYAVYNGTVWEKQHSGADNVVSVFGRAGMVTAQMGDYTTALVTETTNKNYQTDNQKLFNDATSSIQTQLNAKEPAFAKNTAFNKNFGTAAGTVAEGNDIRILNGQTAFGWGNHATAGYAFSNGSNATGTWNISINGNAGTVTNGVYTTGSYANPTWITSLDWGKVINTPTTLAGYGITDSAPSSGSGSYIQNQNASAQSANMWISGAGRFGENQVGTAVRLYNPNLSAGQNISLAVGTSETINNSGFLVWQHETATTDRFLSLETFSNANPIRFGGSKFLFTGGNVGIGTTNPQSKLDVNGDIRISNNANFLQFTPTSGLAGIGSVGSNALNFYVGSGLETRMSILQNGNVGIGTASPNAKATFRVSTSTGSASTDGITINDTDTNPMGLHLGINSASSYSWIQSLHQGYGYEKLALNPNGGNVGIGTSNPLQLLHLNSANPVIQLTKTGILNWFIGNVSGNNFRIQSDSPAVNIELAPTSGNVLIGTTTDNGIDKLQVGGSASFNSSSTAWATSGTLGLNLQGSSTGGISFISTYLDTSSIQIGAGVSQKTGLLIDGQTSTNGSRVAIRTGNAERIIVNNSGVVKIPNLSGTGTRTVVADSSGNLFADGTGTYREAQFIVQLTPNAGNQTINTVYINNIGGTFSVSRTSTGAFTVTNTGLLISNKTTLTIQNGVYTGSNAVSSFCNQVADGNSISFQLASPTGVFDPPSSGYLLTVRVYG